MSDTNYEFTPSVKVPVVQFGLVAGVGVLILLIIAADSTIAAEPELQRVLIAVVAFFTIIVLLRLLVRIFVLRQTTYLITDDDLRREYELLYRRQSREVPIKQLRGMEFEQSRLESLFGFGTVTVLTAGTNQSLGFLEFEYINSPQHARERIRELIAELEGS